MAHGKLQDRTAIITGGASGIGAAAARLFAEEGAHVVVADVDEAAGTQVVAAILAARAEAAGVPAAGQPGVPPALFVPCDVREAQQVEALVESARSVYGAVHVLYGSAGVQFEGTAEQTSLDEFMRCLAVNLAGQFTLCKYGIPALRDAGGGSIVLTSSELGLVGTARTVAYCAAKGGVVNMTRALAIDCAADGIRVNCIDPGPIDTPMLAGWLTDDPVRLAAQLKPVLLGRLGRPEEIARGALFLACDDSSYMTGAQLVLDGGATCWYGL